MRTSRTGLAAILLLAALALTAPAAAQDRPGTVIQAGTQLETHSDANSPDDYVYNYVSVNRHLQGQVLAGMYYVYKHNIDRDSAGGHIAGVNVMRVFNPGTFASMGYSYTVNEEDSTRPQRTDRDRFRFGLYQTLRQRPSGARVLGFASFNTQTDWSEDRTVDLGLMLRQPVTAHWSLNAMAKYSYALGALDTHVYDQYKLALTFKLNDKTDLDLGYVFVDKAYTTPAGAPDDDHVFRAGISYRFQ